jgi:hypothetical protein
MGRERPPGQALTASADRRPGPGVGDGALGFWAALREVFPETRVTLSAYFTRSASAMTYGMTL